MKIKLFDDNKFIPTKSHFYDAGLDLYIPEDIVLYPFITECIDMKIGFNIPESCAGILVPRSSIAKQGVICQTSIIDSGYNGSIHLILTNCSQARLKFNKGERLCSLVCFNIINPVIDIVNDLPESERGNSGLGSTGK